MSDMLEYKGYLGSVHYSDEDETFHGRLEFVRELHRRAMLYARREGTNLNAVVTEALRRLLDRDNRAA